ncbi:cupredoxin domain-containing protein [Candidatus Nitrosotenuis uzonensis]|uniref:Blue (Type 1) copper domain protein (Modular protein) n=1 Tax=Candidatus Nitrosotenuis uzonensis TaxID=1407055 RepID=A0A812F5A7_9ARCH|nr:cupredoxin domain-containing protein [Candidatus Nitrosotenuis uzonensis]CAE6496622.1 Blue (Type 1) copper domain protein (Modular protein) [Candidatus Nitrosotenuis uzonensis]
MSNWDLMMPGMGLTAIGLAGVTVSYAGIAHTFIDGMHALTGLTMFVGLIFLAAGILDGGVSTSNRAKATTLVVLGISLSFAVAAFSFTTITTLPTFAGVMLIVTIPAIVIAYVAMKMPEYTKPISIIFILAVGAAISAYVGFGLYGPSPYLVPPPVPVEESSEKPATTAPVFAISILKGSATQGNPDYEPDEAHVPIGHIIEWTNNDDVSHTVTSSADAGETFNSNLFNAGEVYRLDTSTLAPGKYDYLCIVHPWMTASFILEEPKSAPEFPISILSGSATQGNPDYEPDFAQVPLGNTIVWTNNDDTMHTVTSTDGIFDSSVINAGEIYRLDTSTLAPGKYDYLCIVHPWMTATFELTEGQQGERLAEDATVTDPNSIPEDKMQSEEPAAEPESEIAAPEVSQPAESEVLTDQEPKPVEPSPQEDAVIVSIPLGTSMPGCEKENACFAPSEIRIGIGTTVTWTNDDTAAHTVTSGDVKAGPIGQFDSGLFMAGKSFSFTFETKGQYPYYCQVHPWMTGKVIVE